MKNVFTKTETLFILREKFVEKILLKIDLFELRKSENIERKGK